MFPTDLVRPIVFSTLNVLHMTHPTLEKPYLDERPLTAVISARLTKAAGRLAEVRGVEAGSAATALSRFHVAITAGLGLGAAPDILVHLHDGIVSGGDRAFAAGGEEGPIGVEGSIAVYFDNLAAILLSGVDILIPYTRGRIDQVEETRVGQSPVDILGPEDRSMILCSDALARAENVSAASLRAETLRGMGNDLAHLTLGVLATAAFQKSLAAVEAGRQRLTSLDTSLASSLLFQLDLLATAVAESGLGKEAWPLFGNMLSVVADFHELDFDRDNRVGRQIKGEAARVGVSLP